MRGIIYVVNYFKERGRLRLFLIYFIFIFIFLLKVLLIPFTSHPFDFASYVYLVRQPIDFGGDIFFFWNKGIVLWLLFFSSYVEFDLLSRIAHLSSVPIELYHVLFKMPFIISDILTTFFLYKIVFYLTKSVRSGLVASILWFCNPVVFWITYIHGQYVPLVAFCVTYFIYLVITKKYIYSLLPLDVATYLY
ncbi:MAG: hypothetical protein WCK10_03625, partial [Candidatus Staskawiczbacteria bacterium]